MLKSERKKVEVLAPAGNFEALKCAVNNGADAVYLGLKQYNARAKAGNFTYEELTEAVRYAHFYGVRIYMTFNVLYKPTEYDGVIEAIRKCKEIGVDAFILQDFAFISALISTMPDIVIHLSTQAGIHNLEGALIAQRLGATRIILSRETLLEDIIKISNNTNLEIECFVQGALCISFSGNCYFSSIVSGYSGNRGKCLQLCRKKYKFNGKDGYWLSPKDICLADDMQKLIDAGVTSFKIEGRMRRPEYVGEAVNCYKTVLSGRKYDLNRLKKMFNRGDYTKVYIENPNEDVIYSKSQNHIGCFVGKILKVDRKQFTSSCKLRKGDGVKIFSGSIETGNALISADGNVNSYQGKASIGDSIFVTTDAELNKSVNDKRRFVSFDLTVFISVDNSCFTLKSGNLSVTKEVVFESSKSSPLTIDQIIDCFSKTKDYGLKLNNSEININFEAFAPKSVLNAIRRELCENLSKLIINSHKPFEIKELSNIFEEISWFNTDNISTILQTDSVETANICADLVDYIAYFPKKWTDNTLSEIKSIKKPVLLSLPNVARGEDVSIIKSILSSKIIDCIIVNNLYGLELASCKKILLGPMFNVVNYNFPYSKIMSIESSTSNKGDFVYYYGKFPIMSYSHCPIRSYYGKCKNCDSNYNKTITDERGNEFTLYPFRIKYCYAYLLNDRPINLTGLAQSIPKKFIDLIGVDSKMCYNIVKSIYNGEKISGGTLGYYNKTLE